MTEPSAVRDDHGDFADFDGYPPEPGAGTAAAVDGGHRASPSPDLVPVTDAPLQTPADESAGEDPRGPVEPVAAPRTGNAGVDEATARLDLLDELATAEHAEVFDEVHLRLQQALADLDAG